jgi:carbonic anhydrase
MPICEATSLADAKLPLGAAPTHDRGARMSRVLALGLAALAGATGCAAAPPPAVDPSPSPPAAAVVHAHWSYAGDDGPERWGDLDPSYELCKIGAAQSPVDLPAASARHGPGPLSPRWDPVPLQLTNNGHAIQVDDAASSSFIVEGTTYRLVQFHFHSPSEHTMGGRRFGAEMHLVHKSEGGRLLVVAILFGIGAENASLAAVWKAMPAHPGPSASVPGVSIDLGSLLPKEPRYMRYDGSLTTPPCTEGVTWLVVEPDPSQQLSPEQIEALRASTQPTTNRPVQRLGSREVMELIP